MCAGVITEKLRGIPDLERLVSKIAAATSGESSSGATLSDLIKVLNGLDSLWV
jgi:hypothetical protein